MDKIVLSTPSNNSGLHRIREQEKKKEKENERKKRAKEKGKKRKQKIRKRGVVLPPRHKNSAS